LNKDTPEHTARFSFTPEQMADPSGLYGKWVQIFEDIRIYAGTTTLLAGYNGSGKSTLATQIAHMMTEAGVRSFLISPEMPPEVTWRIMQRQSTNSSEPTHPEWALTERHCRANFLLSTVEDRLTPSQVFAQFDMAYAKGYRMMVLDSLTCVRSGHELHEQANFSDMLRNWSRNHPDCYLLVVAHMRKPAGFIGGQISRYDIRGAGEISDLAGHVWLLQRKNKFSQKEVAAYGEYEAKLIVDKNRATGHLVCKMLRFANVSKLFHQKLSVPRYVEYLEERREEQTNVKRIY
jgi:energy-coupling factor transporter ATP-binding protein EcfA2